MNWAPTSSYNSHINYSHDFLILHLYIYPYAPITSIQINAVLDCMCISFTKLLGSSGNRTRNLAHCKLTISNSKWWWDLYKNLTESCHINYSNNWQYEIGDHCSMYSPFITYRTRFSQVLSCIIELRKRNMRECDVTL